MTEVLPVTDISLPELEAGRRRATASASAGRCRGVARRGSARSTPPAGSPARSTDIAGVTGEICVRAAHVKDRYDRLWATEQRERARPRLAPHRRRRAPGRRRPAVGRGPAGARDHHRRRAGHPGRRRAAGRGPAPRSTAAARRRRRAGRHPAGRGRRRDRAPARAGTGGRRWRSPTWPTRSARGRGPVAAVLVDAVAAGRHPARLQGRPRRGRPLGRPACSPARAASGDRVRVLVTGASGMLGRGVGAAPWSPAATT